MSPLPTIPSDIDLTLGITVRATINTAVISCLLTRGYRWTVIAGTGQLRGAASLLILIIGSMTLSHTTTDHPSQTDVRHRR